jgi:XTP/dITP diphosphohydrolase/tetrapyrrole methylase family protein/MazG family protein/ATP diphosphatase
VSDPGPQVAVASAEAAGAAVARLDAIARRLRHDCPWDREQNERTIVPHTVEEAYELADAARRRDDAKLLDELGDVLFQVHFLALLLEERGAGSLVEVADHCARKLIRRHPHVFGEGRAGTAAEVLRNWDQIKRGEEGREPGIFGDVPETLPALLYARKVQRRAGGSPPPDDLASVDRVREGLSALEGAGGRLDAAGCEERFDAPGRDNQLDARGREERLADAGRGDRSEAAAREERLEAAGRDDRFDAAAREERFDALGDVLFSLVAVARQLHLDPELALRAAADRFREQVLAESAS